jgi:hypothetical protein
MLKPERVLEFIGESPAIRVALDLMKQAAPTDAPVVILGESGTGKGLLARTLHHHAFLVSQQLAHLDYLDEVVDTVSAQIDEVIAPFAEALEPLDTIPGVNKRTAETVIAEIGVDMSVFPTDRHLTSWPREQRERRQTQIRHYSEGQPLAPGRADRSRAGRDPHPRECLRCALPSPHAPPGAQEGRHRCGACDPDHRLLHPRAPHRLPGARGGLLRPPPCPACRPPRRRPPWNARATGSRSNAWPEREMDPIFCLWTAAFVQQACVSQELWQTQ